MALTLTYDGEFIILDSQDLAGVTFGKDISSGWLKGTRTEISG